MRKIKFICLFLFLLCIYGCPSGTNPNNKATAIQDSRATESDTTPIKTQEPEYLILYNQIYDIKCRSEGWSTSTYLSKDKSSHYLKPYEDGFFGLYGIYLDTLHNASLDGFPDISVELNDNNAIYANIVIYNDEKPWNYNNVTDVFIEVNTYSSGLSICNMEVGNSKRQLLNEKGNPEWEYQNVWIYTITDKPNSLAFFGIKNNKVDWIQFGFYKDEIVEDPLNHISILLNYNFEGSRLVK